MKSINEYLIDCLRRTRLYEMAKNQDKCEDLVASQTINILENLVLIHYFKISELYSININHWKNELKTAIYNAGKFRIKDNNSEKRRRRLVERVFNEEDMMVYDDIYSKIIFKMDNEKETLWGINQPTIPRSKIDEWLDQAILSTINQMEDIIYLIISNNYIEIKNWIEKL